LTHLDVTKAGNIQPLEPISIQAQFTGGLREAALRGKTGLSGITVHEI
jgi:hypothetical protein